MRILYLVPSPATREEIETRSHQIPAGWLEAGTTVEWRSVRFGGHRSDSYYSDLVTDVAVVQSGLQAEQEGFDAVCVDTVSDAGLAPLRSRLRIPVVGPGATAYHVACQLGDRFSIVITWERWVHLHRANVARCGLVHRLASIRTTGDHPADEPFGSARRPATLERLIEAARRAVDEDGADVIVPGSTTMHWAIESLSKAVAVPVVNPGLWAAKFAESLVKAGMSHSKRAYPSPEQEVDDLLLSFGPPPGQVTPGPEGPR